jgi:hypothetical protein
VDDGTGVLSCMQWHDQMGIDLGDLVTIRGKIQDYRGKRQMNISQILVENDPNMELLRTLITISNHTIYNMPIKELPGDHIKIPKFVKASVDPVYTDGIYVTETDLNLFILDWLKNHYSQDGNFTYNSILQESTVLSFAKNVLKYQYNDDTPNHSRLCSIVRKSIIDLTKKGDIYLADEDNDIYSLLNVADLDQTVLDWFKHDTCVEILISRLKEDSKYQYSTRARVKESIGRLIEQGFLYAKEHGDYGCV